MATDDRQWLEELSKRTGASVESSDITNMDGKNDEDEAQFREDLEAQYERRGASGQTGSGPEGSTVRAPSDFKKGFGPGGSNENPGGNQSVTQAWAPGSTSGGGDSTGWTTSMNGNSASNPDPRASALYDQLLERSQQSLAIGRNDPIIRAQADAFSANAERSKRNYIGDVAEKQGPLANIRGEERMASEKLGQQTGAFEAELMGQELSARRQEIAQALQGRQGMISDDQRMALTMKLAEIDAAIKREGLALQGQGLDQNWQQALMQNAQFNQGMDFKYWDQDNYWQRN